MRGPRDTREGAGGPEGSEGRTGLPLWLLTPVGIGFIIGGLLGKAIGGAVADGPAIPIGLTLITARLGVALIRRLRTPKETS